MVAYRISYVLDVRWRLRCPSIYVISIIMKQRSIAIVDNEAFVTSYYYVISIQNYL